jgi:rhamnulokinase
MFTNEAGINGTIRFLKNIAGLWLVQQCRADLNEGKQQEFSYVELTHAAEKSPAFRTLLNPQHSPLSLPGGMLNKINAYAKSTNQPTCENPGQFIRCCLESLAMAYRRNLELLESVLERKYECVHIVGGGGRNRLLNQLTADVIGKPVVVGPFEATAVGNGLVQAMAHGTIENLAELRQIVRDSFDLETYQPSPSAAIEAAYDRFCQLPTEPNES